MMSDRWNVVFVTALCFATFTAIAHFAAGQEDGYKFQSLTVSSGEDPISSGITGIADFTKNEKYLIEVAVQHDQAWFLYGRTFKLGKSANGVIAADIGHFQGAPWGGPMLSLQASLGKIAGQQIKVSTLHWPGLFAWEPEGQKDKHPNRPLIGYLASAQANIGPIGLVYSMQNFLDNPWNKLPGVSCTTGVGKNFSASGSATWNTNDEKWMFYIGVTWKPQKT